MKSLSRLLAFIAGFFLFFSSCSDSPSPYKNQTPVKNEPRPQLTDLALPLLATRPGGGLEDGRPKQKNIDEKDHELRNNSLAPIFLGKGAAGITFATTYQESRDILLEEKDILEVDPFELHLYPEGIAVQWDKLGTERPELIMVLTSYLGSLALPDKYKNKDIKLGANLAEFFTDADPRAQIFFNDLYKFIEGMPEDVDLDCFSSGQCMVVPQPNDGSIVYMIGNSTALLVSDDSRKALALVLMTSDAPLLNFRDPNLLPKDTQLTTEFDLAKGELFDTEVLVDGNPISVSIGQRFAEIPEILKPQDLPNPKPYMETFQYAYRGGALSYSRSRYDRNYKVPDANETLQGVVITPAGADSQDIGLKIAGEYYVMRQNGKVETKKPKPKYKLEPGEGMPLPLGTKFNSPGFDRDRSVKANFVQSMAESVLTAMQQDLALSAQPIAQDQLLWLQPSSTGIYGLDSNTEYFGQSGYIDLQAGKARIFEVLTTYNSTTAIYGLSEVSNLIELRSLIARSQPVDLSSRSLAGFTIDQVVEIKDIDRPLEQATLVVGADSKRIEYHPRVSLKILLLPETGYVEEKNMNIHEALFGGVSLGLVPLDGDKFRIASISASGYANDVLGLCDGLELKLGESAEVFKDRLTNLQSGSCRHYSPANPNGLLEVTEVYFPVQRARVNLSSRQVSSVTIY